MTNARRSNDALADALLHCTEGVWDYVGAPTELLREAAAALREPEITVTDAMVDAAWGAFIDKPFDFESEVDLRAVIEAALNAGRKP